MAGEPALGALAGLALAVLALPVVPKAPGETPTSETAMREETDRLTAQLGELRRIPLRAPLERQLITREQAGAELGRTVLGALGDAELATQERILQRLGLLPAGSDYAQLMMEALGASPAASYDPAGARLLVPDWIPLGKQRAALAHEIAHALADQRFGLRRTLDIGPDGRHRLDGDAERARQALIEGDAMTTALELEDARGTFLGGRALPALAERLRAAALAGPGPWDPWIRAVSLFAHVDGLTFVARVRGRESWAGVNALWADPPRSTEQVLHPEKYDAREPPIRLEPSELAALEPGLRPAGGDVLGELGIRTWLANAVSPEVAARAAAGWGGDRVELYVPAGVESAGADGGAPPPPALGWLTVWDDALDAEDFARAAAPVLAWLAHDGMGGEARSPAAPDEAGRVVLHAAKGLYALAWRRDAVALLIGAPDDALSALGEMLDGWRRSPAAPSSSRRRERERPAGRR
jgi:hypothetical protein